ncbi:MAG: hypothetical protein HY238_07365 [Acidobacteria bacterium]|nr:hypothetical protein [Acidobacteriota bacterium]
MRTLAARLDNWLLPIIATLLVFLQIGYSFGEPSHVIFVPWILRRIDPTLLTQDWFVNTIPHHFNSIRFMAALGRHVSLPLATLVLHVLFLLLFFWVAHRIIDHLFGDRRVFFVALFLFLRWGTDGLGGNPLWGNYLVQHNAAVPVCLLAFYLVLKNRPLAAALACAAATWIHIQLGALTMLVVGIGMLFAWRQTGLRTILLGGAVFLLAVAPTVLEQWRLYMAGPSPLSAAEYVYIHAVMRHPHHLIPSSWFGSEYYRFVVLLVMAAWAADWRREPHRTVLAWFAAIFLLCIIGTVFVEIVPVKLVTKLQLWRMTVFVKFFAVAYTARFLLTALEEQGAWKRIAALAVLATPNFSIIGACAAWLLALRATRTWQWVLGLFAAGWIAAVSLAGSLTRGMPIRLFWHHFGIRWDELGMLAACLAVLAAVLWRSNRRLTPALLGLFLLVRAWTWGPYYAYDHPPADEWYQLCQWIKAQTPRDAIFITPPFLGGFQLFAERAEVANYKCVPLIETDLVEWKRRLQDLSGWTDLRCSGWVECGSKLAGGYASQREPVFLRLARQYHAQYVITSQPGHRLNFPELHRIGDFAVYRAPL